MMASLDDLTTDFTKSLNIQDVSTTPALPPAMAATQSATEYLSEMAKHPLFMTSLNDVKDGENIELEAMKALAYEGPPSEVAENFINQGNESFREKRWKDAVEYYAKSITALTQSEAARNLQRKKGGKLSEEEAKEDEEEVRKEKDLLIRALTNRAASNLELKNRRSTKLDCITVLKISPKNIKAVYRLARAHFELDAVYEAERAISYGLGLESDNKTLLDLKVKTEKRKTQLEGLAKTKRDRYETAQRQRSLLIAAIKEAKISVHTTAAPPGDLPADIKLKLADPEDKNSDILFPVSILFPLKSQSDLISAFPGSSNLQEQLWPVLEDPENPLPWDEQREYKLGTVDAYMLNATAKGLIKVGKKLLFTNVLGSGKVRGIVDGVVIIMVVPRGDAAEKWKTQFKEQIGKS
jgi:tetratricopeptide (TPR) repeat protein